MKFILYNLRDQIMKLLYHNYSEIDTRTNCLNWLKLILAWFEKWFALHSESSTLKDHTKIDITINTHLVLKRILLKDYYKADLILVGFGLVWFSFIAYQPL